MRFMFIALLIPGLLIPGLLIPGLAVAQTLTGPAALGDWRADAPGVRRHITTADLPAPYDTPSAGNSPRIVPRPDGAVPHAPHGFTVTQIASGLDNPRALKVAPNGDVFVAESRPGRVLVLRDGRTEVFAAGLTGVFGIAFYPAGPNPRYVYVAETNAIRRFPYQPGDLHARGPAEPVVAPLTPVSLGHSTRDLAFSADGKRLLVSVGSMTNVGETMGRRSPQQIAAWEASHGLGAAWDAEEGRAGVLSFTPEGADRRTFATGLRNCVGLAVQPGTGAVWCSTNERDGLGDDMVPDYVTRVQEGAFYGWPWYWLGGTEEPRLRGQRPDLAQRVTKPDVLLQAHSASLQMAFHDRFPPAWQGAFAAEHGSWNRAKRTGYKVIRIVLDGAGAPTGEYEDFLTGFVVDDRTVWGRPVGVAQAADGALLVSEDGNGTIWRVAYTGP